MTRTPYDASLYKVPERSGLTISVVTLAGRVSPLVVASTRDPLKGVTGGNPHGARIWKTLDLGCLADRDRSHLSKAAARWGCDRLCWDRSDPLR